MTTQTNAAVTTAVQNTQTPKEGITGPMPDPKLTTLADGRTMGQVVGSLDKKDLKVAYEAADKCYDIQWGKDGIEELKGKLKTLENSVGEQVYKIARVAYVHCEGKLLIVRSYFLALCKNAEEHLTAKHTEMTRKAGAAEELTISKLVPQWPVYKSAIAKGLEMGIDPDERREGTVTTSSPEGSPRYPTASKYKTAVDEAVKAAGTTENGTGSQAGNTRQSETQVTNGLSVITSGWSGNLRAAMAVLCNGLNALGHEDQDAFAQQVLDLAGRVAEFAKIRKAGTNPQKFAEAQASSATPVVVDQDVDAGTRAAMQAAIDKDKDPTDPTTAEGQRNLGKEAHSDGKGGKAHGKKGARAA